MYCARPQLVSYGEFYMVTGCEALLHIAGMSADNFEFDWSIQSIPDHLQRRNKVV